MKFAFLIAAHTDIAQLERLVRSLLRWGDVYVHVDKKQKAPDYMERLCSLQSSVNLAGGGNFYT